MEMVSDLVRALEKATATAKQLPTAATAADAAQIYASLQAAHLHLSYFLSHTAPQLQQPRQPSLPLADDRTNGDGDDAPMQLGDDEEEQEADGSVEQGDSKMITVDTVEERMRDCFIQKNKRPKRSLSPSSVAAAERRRWLDYEIESARDRVDFDPLTTKLRALDLIYQFHC